MSAPTDRQPGAKRTLLAWLGLLLVVVSLVWLQIRPMAETLLFSKLKRAPQPFRGLIVLDPGHGGDDSGAMVTGLEEKNLTLDVAQRVQRLARARGLKTVLTREGDRFVSLPNRAAIGNASPDCIFVSIHFNDGKQGTSNGVETYYALKQKRAISSWLPFLQTAAFEPENVQSESLAGLIQQTLVAETQAVDRGVKTEQFYVISHVRHPAVLVEGGFISNKDEAQRLSSEAHREKLAKAICDGIVRYRDLLQARETLATASLSE